MDSARPESTVTIAQVSFDALTEEQVVAELLIRWEQGRGGWISTPNLQQLRMAMRDPSVGELIRSASIVVADGMPVIWASKLRGTPLPGRVPGSDLVWSVARAAADAGATLFLLGGDDGVAERACVTLIQHIPRLQIAGTHTPPFGFEQNEAELDSMRARLTSDKPDVVFVGLGFPKQEQLIVQLSRDFPTTWFLGIGISLSFISGDVPRAPGWMQRAGLEWSYRLWVEPRRLFKRYIVEGIPFAVFLLAQSCSERCMRRIANR